MKKNLKIKLFNISTGVTDSEYLAVNFLTSIMEEHADFFEEFLIKEAMRGKREATIQVHFSRQESSSLNSFGFGTLSVKIPMMIDSAIIPSVMSKLAEILEDDYNLIVERSEGLSLKVRW